MLQRGLDISSPRHDGVRDYLIWQHEQFPLYQNVPIYFKTVRIDYLHRWNVDHGVAKVRIFTLRVTFSHASLVLWKRPVDSDSRSTVNKPRFITLRHLPAPSQNAVFNELQTNTNASEQNFTFLSPSVFGQPAMSVILQKSRLNAKIAKVAKTSSYHSHFKDQNSQSNAEDRSENVASTETNANKADLSSESKDRKTYDSCLEHLGFKPNTFKGKKLKDSLTTFLAGSRHQYVQSKYDKKGLENLIQEFLVEYGEIFWGTVNRGHLVEDAFVYPRDFQSEGSRSACNPSVD